MIKFFPAPIDASARVLGFGNAIGFRLLNINYVGDTEQGYVIRLVRPDMSESSEVIGVPEDSPAEVAAIGHVSAWLASA